MMATMLDALDVQPGMRVLEVGTGTGYNAALIASLVEDPRLVTTLDIDPDAVDQARQAITQVIGQGMTIVQGDGAKGYPANAPYDRIIVTASSPTVSHAWMEQLAPNGILVCVLQPGFTMLGGLLKAQKTEEILKGKILGPATFMVLRDTIYTKRTIQIDSHASLYASFPFDPTLFPPQLMRKNHDFAFFLYYELLDLYVFQKKEDLFFSTETSPQGYVVFRQSPASQVELHGDRSCACALWNRLVRAYSLWLHCGRPTITQYHFEMDNDGQSLSIPTPFGVVWPFVR
jgi:protein-L-isoaspartate(D-aspartate) O-methyltransferase